MDVLDALNRRRFILLTTYDDQHDGVVNRLWFAVDDGRILAVSSQGSEVQRIRNDPRVWVAGVDEPGEQPAATFEGRARILPAAEWRRVDRLLNRKYGWRRRLFRRLLWLGRVGDRPRWRPDALIEIELHDEAA